MSEREGEYGLVMPFVVCRSQGGTLDDHAFVIGCEIGSLDSELHTLANMPGRYRPTPAARYLHSEGIPQVDLVAMRHGFTLTAEPWEDDASWTLVTFAPTVQDEGDVDG